MAWDSVTDRSKIAGMLKELVSAKSEIKVSLTGEPESFFSRITSFKKDKEGGKPARLLIEKLAPDKGNLLLQSSSDLILEFFEVIPMISILDHSYKLLVFSEPMILLAYVFILLSC